LRGKSAIGERQVFRHQERASAYRLEKQTGRDENIFIGLHTPTDTTTDTTAVN
jgi:hypothetical protein